MIRSGEVYAIRFTTGVYIGSARGSSLRRWNEHLRLLRMNNHHCRVMQDEFNNSGIGSFLFSILDTGIPINKLFQVEAERTRLLCGVNSIPKEIIREEKRQAIVNSIKSGIKYREIVKKFSVSLGSISKIKYEAGLLKSRYP